MNLLNIKQFIMLLFIKMYKMLVMDSLKSYFGLYILYKIKKLLKLSIFIPDNKKFTISLILSRLVTKVFKLNDKTFEIFVILYVSFLNKQKQIFMASYAGIYGLEKKFGHDKLFNKHFYTILYMINIKYIINRWLHGKWKDKSFANLLDYMSGIENDRIESAHIDMNQYSWITRNTTHPNNQIIDLNKTFIRSLKRLSKIVFIFSLTKLVLVPSSRKNLKEVFNNTIRNILFLLLVFQSGIFSWCSWNTIFKDKYPNMLTREVIYLLIGSPIFIMKEKALKPISLFIMANTLSQMIQEYKLVLPYPYITATCLNYLTNKKIKDKIIGK